MQEKKSRVIICYQLLILALFIVSLYQTKEREVTDYLLYFIPLVLLQMMDRIIVLLSGIKGAIAESVLWTLRLLVLQLFSLMLLGERLFVFACILAVIILHRSTNHLINLICQEYMEKRYRKLYLLHGILGGAVCTVGIMELSIFPLCFVLYIFVTVMMAVIVVALFRKKVILLFKNRMEMIIVFFLLMPAMQIPLAFRQILSCSSTEIFSYGWVSIVSFLWISLFGLLFYRNKKLKEVADQILLLILEMLGGIILFVFIGNLPFMTVLLGFCILFTFEYVRLLCSHLDYRPEADKTRGIKQIQREEKIHKEIADFLHDEVLQDINALIQMNRMMPSEESKNRIHVQLEKMNSNVRRCMNEHHPVILPNLSLYENYYFMILTVQERFPESRTLCRFEAEKSLVLIAPYDVLVYRWIRELVNNGLKYAGAENIEIKLSVIKNRVFLQVADDGLYEEKKEQQEGHGMKGIRECLMEIGGSFAMSREPEGGLAIRIEFEMLEENSNECFVNR